MKPQIARAGRKSPSSNTTTAIVGMWSTTHSTPAKAATMPDDTLRLANDAAIAAVQAHALGDAHRITDSNSIAQRITSDEQHRIDNLMSAWFARESELGAYTSEQLRELGKYTI
jgi:hypothetical protein